MTNLKYIIGVLLAIPLLPIMLIQGILIRRKVPKLPAATGSQGIAKGNNGEVLRLLVTGESTMAGIGVQTHEEGFAGTLAKELATETRQTVDWKVYAEGGYTAKMITEQMLPTVQETAFDLIVIGLGGNDAFTLNTPWRWNKHIRELIEALRVKFPNAMIVFANMPPIKGFPAFTSLIKFFVGNLVEILGENLQTAVHDYDNVYYYGRVITLEDWTKRLNIGGSMEDYFSDGVHPSKLTYQIWAKDLVNYMFNTSIV